MNDALAFIQKRRSIRRYKDEPVSDEQVETLLRAAMAAPSAGNEQPWEFVVMRDRDAMQKVLEFHAHGTPLVKAGLGILVCGNRDRIQYDEMWLQDCSAATQNILLAAANMGLGTCWLGVHPRPERIDGLRKLCNLPDDVMPFALISVGVPDEDKGPADYYDPARVHQETF